MIKKRVHPLEFYKSQGLNLYPVIEKRPGHYVNGNLVGLPGWESIKDFEELSNSVKSNDNYGFRTGIQYKSNKNIIVLDFDNNSKDGASASTSNLYDRFALLDSANSAGFYSSSTCGNYGVIVDITNSPELHAKIEEVSRINKNKIEVEHLEILYKSNVILPPSKTTCKVHQKVHNERRYINNRCGFCIPNEEQVKFILECLDTFIKNSKRSRLNKERDVIINTSDGTKIEVRRIPTRKMLGILECLKECRFVAGYNDWIKLLYMIANGNNSQEVIAHFWERCKVGKYSTVSLEHITSFFTGCDIEPEFNNAPLWKLAREDNPVLFANLFNRYDEPQFEYNKIRFQNAEGKNTKFINYNQVMDYFTISSNTITKLNVICSGLGTGKTSFIEKRVRQQNKKAVRIIFITMRQTLAYSIMCEFNKLGFKNYLDKKNKVSYYTSKLIISLDSLERITIEKDEEMVIPKYDLVICDEIASLLSHFSYQNIHDVDKVYRIFTRIIKESNECYLMDGDISNREILWLKNYMGYDIEQKLPLFNELQGKQYNLVLSYCANGQYNKILKDLEEGNNICVVCMSATEAEKLYELVNQKYRSLLIISRTGDKQKKKLEDVNSLVLMYRCFIYSPTITVGVNIDCIHFDKIYGYVCEGSVCARDYYQMLNRIRNPKENTINILIGSFNMKFHGLHNVVPFETYKTSIYGDEVIDGLSYIKLWNKWENDHKGLWLDTFKWYAEKKGHRLIVEESSKELFQIEKEKFKENLERLQIEINKKPMPIEEIYNTPRLATYKLDVMPETITNEERDRICAKPMITDEDKVMLAKIDKDNGWDVADVIQERVRLNIANPFDKARLEKTLYCNMFELNDNSSLEEFKNMYNKIGIVINNAKLNNLAGIDDLLSLAPVENRSLDELILSKKVEYMKKIQLLLNINDFNNARYIDNIDYDGLRELVNDKNMYIVFGIINTEEGTKKLKKKKDGVVADSNMRNINIVKKILQDYGYVLNSKRVRNGKELRYVYSIEILDAVKKYTTIQKRNMIINDDNVVEEVLEF